MPRFFLACNRDGRFTDTDGSSHRIGRCILNESMHIVLFFFNPVFLFSAKEFVENFLEGDYLKILEHSLSPLEEGLQGRVLNQYTTQKRVVNLFRSSVERFGLREKFGLDELSDTTYYYGDREGLPTPKEIRRAIRSFQNGQ